MRRPALLLALAALAVTLAVGPAAGAATSTDGNETVLRAEIQGTTATNLSVPADSEAHVRSTVATELGVDERRVRVVPHEDTVEVRARNVSTEALRNALGAAGLDASSATIRERVTEATQDETVSVIDERLAQVGIDATVREMTTDGGGRGVAIRARDASRAAVVGNLSFEGHVEMVAHFPEETGSYREVTLLTNDDFVEVGAPQPPTRAQHSPYVAVSLADEAAQNYSAAMQTFGFTSAEGVANCPTDLARRDPANAPGYCLYTVYDGDVVYAAQMSRGLAQEFESGDFVHDPSFVITATNMSEARNLSMALRAGALPAPLEFDSLSDDVPQNATDDGGVDVANSTETPTTTGGDGAGFTTAGALLALLGVVVVARRTGRN